MPTLFPTDEPYFSCVSGDEQDLNQILKRIYEIEQSICAILQQLPHSSDANPISKMDCDSQVMQWTRQSPRVKKKKFLNTVAAALSHQLENNPNFSIQVCTKYSAKRTNFEHLKHSFKLSQGNNS